MVFADHGQPGQVRAVSGRLPWSGSSSVSACSSRPDARRRNSSRPDARRRNQICRALRQVAKTPVCRSVAIALIITGAALIRLSLETVYL